MEKIKIGIQSYKYSCDNIFINGERIGDIPNGSAECALHLVLAYLGYEVEIEGLDTNEEVTWTM